MTDDASQRPAESATGDPDVVRIDARSRYVIRVDGVTAGFSAFEEEPGRVVFTHTVVKPEFEGMGIGSRLAKAALDDVVARGLVIVPVCPFIHAYLRRHSEYAASVVEPRF
ncbi:N-acetyltransferase [Agromyces protaetiae]|uniref:N-acetyltransferase n=1 Tax=Agromyces protaetiae TaxID=2509455 RepID=A0A4P6F9S6_9MICO|nr:GNAT family N-acetyltransferase [Agromyces protaetiae]QAY72316.1 N-acetyltransferase [Agromyces protaetiae]